PDGAAKREAGDMDADDDARGAGHRDSQPYRTYVRMARRIRSAAWQRHLLHGQARVVPLDAHLVEHLAAGIAQIPLPPLEVAQRPPVADVTARDIRAAGHGRATVAAGADGALPCRYRRRRAPISSALPIFERPAMPRFCATSISCSRVRSS